MPPSSPASRHVLIVEDRSSVASLYRTHLEAAGYDVALCAGADAAANVISRSQPFAVLLSLELPGGETQSLIAAWAGASPRSRIIAIAANASINAAVDAVRAGAWDYLVRPVSRNRLLTTLANATDGAAPVAPAPRAIAAPTSPAKAQPDMIGTSPAMRELTRQIAAMSASSAPVFITGESGTGKELCAQAIHDASRRADKPFIALNCGAIPHDLMESEIFGHLKGAFTGAISDREGAAAAADGGTLFLDEICEMDLHLQTKLLRFLQTGTIQPVGSAHTRTVDIRIVCATNRTPQAEVAEGRFREDLFFRLHVLPLNVAPLRARVVDIPALATAFLKQYAREEAKRFCSISPPALDRLMAHAWPGNVRELQNAIRQAVVLHDEDELDAHMLPASVCAPHAVSPATSATMDGRQLWQIERDVIEAAIQRFAGSIPKAAGALGISASTIYRKRESWQTMTA